MGWKVPQKYEYILNERHQSGIKMVCLPSIVCMKKPRREHRAHPAGLAFLC